MSEPQNACMQHGPHEFLILKSGMDLGHYIPALLLRDTRRQVGRTAEGLPPRRYLSLHSFIKRRDADLHVGFGARHHALDLMANCLAVISKPAGMSIAESLMTATPLVFLPPFGGHERQNASNLLESFTPRVKNGRYVVQPVRRIRSAI